MRPLTLTMQAFGPYREQETVDFTELGPNRVFLIHGDTGAGKTTILDAMVFALYDDTSGGERRAAQMRCESAADTLPTEVTFDFALGAKRFRVRRRPAQELTGARGATVAKPAEAAVWDRTGCGSEREGKLLTTKITEANTLLKEQLGFSCEQFRQVVVLPQGRFRELLSAGSDKREDILRQLFKTSRFRQLEDALAERARTVRRQMDELRVQRDAQLGLVDAVDDAGLAALAQVAASELAVTSACVCEAAAASLAADEALAGAETADEARRAVLVARTELEALDARGAEVDGMRLTLDTAVRADRVQPVADRLDDARERSAAAALTRREIEGALTDAQAAETAAGESLAAENQRALEREEAADAVRRLARPRGGDRRVENGCGRARRGPHALDLRAARGRGVRGGADLCRAAVRLAQATIRRGEGRRLADRGGARAFRHREAARGALQTSADGPRPPGRRRGAVCTSARRRDGRARRCEADRIDTGRP